MFHSEDAGIVGAHIDFVVWDFLSNFVAVNSLIKERKYEDLREIRGVADSGDC